MNTNQIQFEHLLKSLLSIDNEDRKQSEELYKNLPRELKVTNLLDSIRNVEQSDEMRQMAAVLLRRFFKIEFLAFYKPVIYIKYCSS